MSFTSRRSLLRYGALGCAVKPLATFGLSQESAVPKDRLNELRQKAANFKVTPIPLRGNISILRNMGGNIALLCPHPSDTAGDGIFVVDSGYSGSSPGISNAISQLSTAPISLLINTHWHFDHTDGNAWLHERGAKIVATAKTRERLSTTQYIRDFKLTVPPLPAGGLPTDVLMSDRILRHNTERLSLAFCNPAHTDTDLTVHFQNADVLHTGDIYANAVYPFIDYTSGGSIDGMILATEKLLKTAGPKTIVVPGHGVPADKAQLGSYYDMLTDSRQKIAALKHQGRTLEEVVAANPTAQYDTAYGANDPGFWVKMVFEGV